MKAKRQFLAASDVIYSDARQGPAFIFKGKNFKDDGIIQQIYAIWAGYAEYPEVP